MATVPLSSFGCTSDWIQVPAGVFEFQEDTSSVKGNESVVQADVQVPESYHPEPSIGWPRTATLENGSVYWYEPKPAAIFSEPPE